MAKKILIVDDEPDLLMVSLLRLNKTGYVAFGASDGLKGLEVARQKKPNLIILDVFLPGMNGDEVAKILKSDEKTKHIPIVLISADTKMLEARARESGAEGYLGKVFESKDLIAIVEKYLPLTPLGR